MHLLDTYTELIRDILIFNQESQIVGSRVVRYRTDHFRFRTDHFRCWTDHFWSDPWLNDSRYKWKVKSSEVWDYHDNSWEEDVWKDFEKKWFDTYFWNLTKIWDLEKRGCKKNLGFNKINFYWSHRNILETVK